MKQILKPILSFFLYKIFFFFRSDRKRPTKTISIFDIENTKMPFKLISIFPELKIERTAPKYLGNKINSRFVPPVHGITTVVKKTFVAHIPKVKIYGNNGIIINSKNYIIKELSKEIGKKEKDLNIFSKIFLPKPKKIPKKSLVLTAPGADVNYFHWLMDLIPRYGLIEQSKIELDKVDNFIVGHKSLPFQIETLQILNIPKEKIVNINNYKYLKLTEAIIPSYVGLSGNMPKWSCEFLREKFITQNIESTKKFFISRGDAKYRKLINESQVAGLLRNYGFEIIAPEKLSFSEQVKLFQSANIIIAPHGAGLTNIVFCNPGTKIIELFSPHYINQCFWTIASHCNLEYYYILGKGQIPNEYKGEMHKDMEINIENLKQLLGK